MTFWDAQLHKGQLHDCVEELELVLSEGEGSTDAASLAVERTVFWIAFAVRKLGDNHRLSDELESRRFEVRLHPRRPGTPTPDHTNCQDFEQLYAMDFARRGTLSMRRLCGLLIHSFIVFPVLADDDHRPAGVLVNSSLTKDEGLYFVEWAQLRALVDAVCDDPDRDKVPVGSVVGRSRL